MNIKEGNIYKFYNKYGTTVIGIVTSIYPDHINIISLGHVSMKIDKCDLVKATSTRLEPKKREWLEGFYKTWIKQARKIKKTGKFSTQREVFAEFKRRLSREFRGFDYEIMDDMLSTRYLGSWQLPPDADEDEEDYDWKIPTKETRKAIEKIIQDFKKDTKLQIMYSVEEKCYIDFSLR